MLTVDPLQVITVGATEIRSVFPADQVPGIIVAYMQGIKTAFAVTIAGAGLSFLLCLFGDWKKQLSMTGKQGSTPESGSA